MLLAIRFVVWLHWTLFSWEGTSMLKFDVKLAQGRTPPLLYLCAVVHVMLASACALPMIMVGICLLFVTTMTWHCALVAPWMTKMHCPRGSLARELLVGLIIYLVSSCALSQVLPCSVPQGRFQRQVLDHKPLLLTMQISVTTILLPCVSGDPV
jgi:hypothetical protein